MSLAAADPAPRPRPIALIGGLDPAGLAGLAADLEVCFSMGARGMPVIAARTAQRTGLWSRAWPTDAEELANTLATLEAPAAIKLGMLGQLANAQVVAAWSRQSSAPLVVDPLLYSTSGGWMWGQESQGDVRVCLREVLLPRAAVVTPNWPELAWLAGAALPQSLAEAQKLAQALPCPVILKGGHAPAPWLGQDWLWDGDRWLPLAQKPVWPTSPPGLSRRGTGCRLATGIAIGLAAGKDLPTACENAARWLDRWAYGL